MFTIQKDLNGIFWHIYNNLKTKVNVSDFDIVVDAVALTFIIQCKNGSNIPSQAISISLIEVVDLSVGTSPIPFSGAAGLIQLLKSLDYTPYLEPPTTPIVIYRVGQVGVFKMTQDQIDANFDGTGLGTNVMLGWAKRNGQNGTLDQRGKFSINQGSAPFATIGASGGNQSYTLLDSNLPSRDIRGVIDGSTFNADVVKTSGTVIGTTDGASSFSIMNPHLIDLWVERVTELVINSGSGGGGVTQDLAMVLAVDNKTNEIPILSNSEDGYLYVNDEQTVLGNDFGGVKKITISEDTFRFDTTVRFDFESKGINLNTTSDGLGIPRLTTGQMNAIVAPTEGMIVYNTTESETYQYNGATWNALGGGAVDSVNGQTGVIVLDAADVGADAITTATTGAVISFATPQVYNSIASPSSSNLTDNLTGARIGVVQKIYHNAGTAPTVPAGWVLRGTGAYVTSTLNIIYAEWSVGTTVEYWITQ